MSDDVTGDPGAPQPRRGLGQELDPHGAMPAWYLPTGILTRRSLRLFGRTLRLAHSHSGAPYDLLVVWYLWVVAIVLVLALIALGAILVQRRRRSGGVLSVRPRPKRRRQ